MTKFFAAKQSLFPQIVSAIFLIGIAVITGLPHAGWIEVIEANYLWIHTILELVGILVSFAVFTVGWATYQNVRSTDILVLSVICFVIGWLDLFHTLSFTGMPDFITPSNPNKAIYFWLASRLAGSIGFLYVSVSRARTFRDEGTRVWLMAGAVTWTFLWFYLIIFELESLPTMFVQGVGLTDLKKLLEWATILTSAAAGVFFFTQGSRKNVVSFYWMGCASLLYAMAGFFFTIYREFDDLNNFAGHVYKAFASFIIYRAVFVECISKPYEEAKRLAKEASDANNSKSRFLANVSHELRTPLGVISGFSELLNQSDQLTPEPREWAGTINRNSRQLRELIDDLLDLSKAEHEMMDVEWSEFNVNEVVQDVASSLALQANAKGVSIRVENHVGENRKVKSDVLRFRQILTNVAGNAVKFTLQGDVVIAVREQTPSGVSISVKDSGIGISVADAEKLFQPFAQANDPSLRRFGGTGLGLALSKKLSLLLGGDLVLEKSETDIGSEFKFWIADQDVEIATRAPREEIKPQTPDFSRLRILAAEDSSDNRNLLSLYLKPTQAQLTFAVNGKQALAFAAESEFDLVLMDIQMPEMDGFEAVSRLRQDGFKPPIFALTAHAHAPERDRALNGGFNGYLIKPLSRKDLWMTIERMSR